MTQRGDVLLCAAKWDENSCRRVVCNVIVRHLPGDEYKRVMRSSDGAPIYAQVEGRAKTIYSQSGDRFDDLSYVGPEFLRSTEPVMENATVPEHHLVLETYSVDGKNHRAINLLLNLATDGWLLLIPPDGLPLNEAALDKMRTRPLPPPKKLPINPSTSLGR